MRRGIRRYSQWPVAATKPATPSALHCACTITLARNETRRKFGLDSENTAFGPPAGLARTGRTSASLTPTEHNVADLVTEECTNAAIANRLSVSKRTVDKHVSKFLAELELRSRIQIAGVLASPLATARMSEQTDTLAI
ncbi:helix-turn-helix transcriptional regulator [Nocardia sp. NPDC004604]|uniref:helix-turn-helix transcriptional regulator n=1 Tax=Nocardia sp. NPDC004604 TaxID=3157013 RepID=UPI0033B8350D